MPALPQNMDNCYGLGKLQKGLMKCSSQGCEKELCGFLLSTRGQNLEFTAMGTSCICKAFLRDYECDASSFHEDKYDACNLTSLKTGLSCQHGSLFSFCVSTVQLSQSGVSPVLTWAFPQGSDCTCCPLSPGWFFS